MAKLGILNIHGKSGFLYEFEAFPLNTVWTPLSAVYVITHRDVHCEAPTEHVYLRIGQSRNLQTLPPPTPAWTARHRANCLCILEEKEFKRRREIMSDIAAAHYFPH